MGKGNKGTDHVGELGENMLTTMALNRIKYLAGVLLEKHYEVLCHNGPEKTSRGTPAGDSVGQMRPTTFLHFGTAR